MPIYTPDSKRLVDPEMQAKSKEQSVNALKWIINNLTPGVVHEPTKQVDMNALSDEQRLALDPGLMDSESPLDVGAGLAGAELAKIKSLSKLRGQAGAVDLSKDTRAMIRNLAKKELEPTSEIPAIENTLSKMNVSKDTKNMARRLAGVEQNFDDVPEVMSDIAPLPKIPSAPNVIKGADKEMLSKLQANKDKLINEATGSLRAKLEDPTLSDEQRRVLTDRLNRVDVSDKQMKYQQSLQDELLQRQDDVDALVKRSALADDQDAIDAAIRRTALEKLRNK